MGDDYSNFASGWVIGGHNNTYVYPCAEPKPSKKVKIDQSKQKSFLERIFPNRKSSKNKGHSQAETSEERPPAGAFSLAYSFIPYGQHQYPPPPPPPYQYGGYGGPHRRMADYGHGYYEGSHGPSYPGPFPSPNKADYNYVMYQEYYSGTQHVNMGPLPDHGGATAPVYGHDQHGTVDKQKLDQDNHNHGGELV